MFLNFILKFQSFLAYLDLPITTPKGWRAGILYSIFFISFPICYYITIKNANLAPYFVLSFIFFISSLAFLFSYIQVYFFEDYLPIYGTVCDNNSSKINFFNKSINVFNPVFSYEVVNTKVTSIDASSRKIDKYKIGKKYKLLVSTKSVRNILNETNLKVFLIISAIFFIVSFSLFINFYLRNF